jgi:hypothetical protein
MHLVTGDSRKAVLKTVSANVRFGSKADMCGAKGHVRFTPDNDRESGFPHKVMSALPPRADMCGATWDVRFGPKADIRQLANVPAKSCLRAILNGFAHAALSAFHCFDHAS